MARIKVSKTLDGGSIPSTCAIYKEDKMGPAEYGYLIDCIEEYIKAQFNVQKEKYEDRIRKLEKEIKELKDERRRLSNGN